MNLFNSLYTDDVASFYFNHFQEIAAETVEEKRITWLIQEQEKAGLLWNPPVYTRREPGGKK